MKCRGLRLQDWKWKPVVQTTVISVSKMWRANDKNRLIRLPKMPFVSDGSILVVFSGFHRTFQPRSPQLQRLSLGLGLKCLLHVPGNYIGDSQLNKQKQWQQVVPLCDWKSSSSGFVLSPMLVNDDYAPQRAEHASLPGHTAVLATEPSQLRAPYYGTVFHRTWNRRTYCTVNFGGR